MALSLVRAHRRVARDSVTRTHLHVLEGTEAIAESGAVDGAPGQRHGGEGRVFPPWREPRRAVDTRCQGQEIAVLERVVQTRHVRLERPLRDLTADVLDGASRAEIPIDRILGWQAARLYAV